MTAVVFETPGLIDMRAFTIIGAHAKPNSTNPIGFFGSGLKYVMAILVRLGAEPIVWIGEDKLTFSKKTSKFRGTDLETIKMTVLKAGNKRATSYELPFTTRYGARWDVWMAFRELESNTRDEGGKTYTVDTRTYGDNRLDHERFDLDEVVRGTENVTRIVIDLPVFAEAAEKIDEVFLPRARRSAPGTILEAFEGESDKMYYRTMRAMDLKKPSIFTYNLIEEQTLTEDRTLMHEYHVKQAVARWVLTAATADEVEAVLKADEDAWEHGLEFPGYVKPSAAFEEVMRSRRRGVSKNAWAYYGRYAAPKACRIDTPWSLNTEHPRPWRVEGLEVLDSTGNAVFAAPEGYYDDWERTAEAIVARINIIGRVALPERPPIDVVENEEASDPRFAGHGPALAEKEEMPF